MERARRLLLSLALALAVALGQHAAALHGLEHAHKDLAAGSPQSTQDCERHALFATLGSALGCQAPASAAIMAELPAEAAPAETRASLSPRYSFLSRAPPTSSV